MSESASSSDDVDQKFGRAADERSSSMASRVRKHSLRNITPRSYSSLLKSETEEEEEEEEQEAEKGTERPNVAAASKQGRQSFVSNL